MHHNITHESRVPDIGSMKVGLFTDTFDDINGVARFLHDMGRQAELAGRSLTIHTSVETEKDELPFRRNFLPIASWPLPYYPNLNFTIPPIIEMLEWSERQRFDVIHVSTPGPVGLCGWWISRMLGVPLLQTYHTDFPAYVRNLTCDSRLPVLAHQYLRWLCGQAVTIFSRSRQYVVPLRDLGVPAERIVTLTAGIDTIKFNAHHRDETIWREMGVDRPLKLLYCGRISVEKNLPMLAEVFKRICSSRNDVALVLAGNGPYLEEMQRSLAGLPAHFPGVLNDRQLAPLYASADLFVFPSLTDTLGQVVLEAMASGLPVLVSDQGGPAEITEHDLTGLILPGRECDAWVDAIHELLDDPMRRRRLGRTAHVRSSRFSLERSFEHFWSEHAKAVNMGSRPKLAGQAGLGVRPPWWMSAIMRRAG